MMPPPPPPTAGGRGVAVASAARPCRWRCLPPRHPPTTGGACPTFPPPLGISPHRRGAVGARAPPPHGVTLVASPGGVRACRGLVAVAAAAAGGAGGAAARHRRRPILPGAAGAMMVTAVAPRGGPPPGGGKGVAVVVAAPAAAAASGTCGWIRGRTGAGGVLTAAGRSLAAATGPCGRGTPPRVGAARGGGGAPGGAWLAGCACPLSPRAVASAHDAAANAGRRRP